MGILNRFGEIMASNINDFLDKCEDPAKMVEQKHREAKEALAEVRKETAGVIAQEKATKDRRDALAADVKKFTDLATKAVAAGNDDDARAFLTKKNEIAAQLVDAEEIYQTAKLNADQMRQMHDHLVDQIQEMERRKANIKATAAAAKTQEKINKMTMGVSRHGDLSETFDTMEGKAKDRLNAARAMADLAAPQEDEADKLAAKYAGVGGQSVEDELASMKAALNGGAGQA